MTLLEAIAVTAELLGTELSRGALLAMEDDLSNYPEQAVLTALTRCRRELSGRLTLAAVIERLEQADGRPGADESWAMALEAEDEAQTVVWTDEISEAFSCARPLLDINDKVGARMAFRQAYERITRDARQAGRMAEWTVSLGWDRDLRTEAIQRAMDCGRLTTDQAQRFLPSPSDGGPVAQLLLTGNVVQHPAIEQARLAELRRAIQEGQSKAEEREAAKKKRRIEREARIKEKRQEALDFVDSKSSENKKQDEKAGS